MSVQKPTATQEAANVIMDAVEEETATGQLSSTSLVSGANRARTEIEIIARANAATEETATGQKSSSSIVTGPRSATATETQGTAIARDNDADTAVQKTGYQSTTLLVIGLVNTNVRKTLIVAQETLEGRESSSKLV